MKLYPIYMIIQLILSGYNLPQEAKEVIFFSFAGLALFSHSFHNVLVADSGKQKEAGNKENQHIQISPTTLSLSNSYNLFYNSVFFSSSFVFNFSLILTPILVWMKLICFCWQIEWTGKRRRIRKTIYRGCVPRHVVI